MRDPHEEEELSEGAGTSPATRKSPRKSPFEAERQENEFKRMMKEFEALAALAWCGQAEKLGPAEKFILSHYHHRVVKESKLMGGRLVEVPSVKYTSKYERRERSMSMKGLNATRLGEYLLKSDSTPFDVKEAVATKMRSAVAKEFIENLQSKRRAQEAATQQSELLGARKKFKSDGSSQAKEDERNGEMDKFVVKDPPMPSELFNLCLHYMSVFFIMCRIPFAVATSRYFLKFIWSLRPAFVKYLPSASDVSAALNILKTYYVIYVPISIVTLYIIVCSLCHLPQLREKLAGSLLDELYEEAQVITREKLADLPGRVTLGIDGHKLGKRQVETLTKAKLGVSTFLSAELLGNTRATGKHLATLASKFIDDSVIAIVADNTSNNSGRRTGLFAELQSKYPKLLCLGCCVHVLDLLVEDVAKLSAVTQVGADAHFLSAFVKKHALLYEEFLLTQKRLDAKLELELFPLTRFAYMHLMCYRVAKNFAVLRDLSESNVVEVLTDQARKRGESGAKSLAEFRKFEELAGSIQTRKRVMGVATLLEPLSAVLHYLEGDSVPISHVYPCYQLLYDYVQQLDMQKSPDLMEVFGEDGSDELDRVCGIVRERWLGTARKKGLKDDVHFCAFALDPYAQAAFTTPQLPECDLLTSEVTQAARTIFRHLFDNPAQRAILVEQFGLWCAASPRLAGVGSSSDEVAGPSGNNGYSSLYHAGMQLAWEKTLQQQAPSGNQRHETHTSSGVKHALTKLKACSKPTEFWLAMQAEAPRGAGQSAVEAHRFFCKVACDIVAIVGHTAGVERAGKGYGLVFTKMRQRLDPQRAHKAIYCLENYGLVQTLQESGGGLDNFVPRQKDTDAESEQLPRGNLIVKDVLPDSDDDEGDTDDAEVEEDAEAGAIEWHLPAGFKVAPQPQAVDSTCIGKYIYMNCR